MTLLEGRRLYLCTPDRPDIQAFLQACIRGGVDVVQLREKHLEPRQLLARASLAAQVCRDYGVPFILNDRPDLALELNADGVHVGQTDGPVKLCRRILGTTAAIGLSTHSQSELDAAMHEPCDYISVGPVVPTPTKPGRPGTGLEYVTYAARCSKKTFFVTGGVNPVSVPDLAQAGARRFVVVRYLTEAGEPEKRARQLADQIAFCTQT